jgi:hypothetical protein
MENDWLGIRNKPGTDCGGNGASGQVVRHIMRGYYAHGRLLLRAAFGVHFDGFIPITIQTCASPHVYPSEKHAVFRKMAAQF